MPLPIAHGLVGASIIAVMSSRDPVRVHWHALAVGAGLAICPDFDVFFSAVLGLGNRWHGSFSHSITFAILVGLLVPWLLGISPITSRFVAATASHGFLDALTGKELHDGEELLWPFSTHRFRLGLFDYFHLGPTNEESALQTAKAFLSISLFEAAIFVPMFILAIRVCKTSSRFETRPH